MTRRDGEGGENGLGAASDRRAHLFGASALFVLIWCATGLCCPSVTRHLATKLWLSECFVL